MCIRDSVETYMIGAMSPEHALRYFQLTPNKVVIVGGDRAEIVLAALDTPTVAVVLTGNYVPSPAALERAEERGVPLVSVETDTVSAADGMRRLFGRLRVKDRAKIDLIAKLIDEAVDEERVRALLPAGVQHVSVVHAPDVIGYEEEPATAARARTGSSIVVGLK